MKPLKIVRNTLIGLGMLAYTALGFEPSFRQAEISPSYTSNDSVTTKSLLVHGQLDKNDIFLNFNKNEEAKFEGYLNLDKKHLLGYGKLFLERTNWEKDEQNKNSANLISAEHSILTHPLFRNSLGFNWGEKKSESEDSTKVDTSLFYDYETYTIDLLLKQKENNFSNQTETNKSFFFKQNLFKILEFMFEKENRRINYHDSTFKTENQIRIIPEYSIVDTADKWWDKPGNGIIDIDEEKYSLNLNLTKIIELNLNLSAEKFKFTETYLKTYLFVDNTNPEGTLFDNNFSTEKELNRKVANLTLKDGLKQMHYLYSNMNGEGKTDFENDNFAPPKAKSDIETRSQIHAGNVMFGKNFIHNISFKTDNFFHEEIGDTLDTLVTGFDPKIAHEDVKSFELGYKLLVPFNNWARNLLIKSELFRRFVSILEEQKDQTLGIDKHRRNWYLYSPIPKTELSLNYKAETSQPWDQKHVLEEYKIKIKHTLINTKHFRFAPSYTIEYSSTNSSYEDTLLSTIEASKIISRSNTIGAEIYLPKWFTQIGFYAKQSSTEKQFKDEPADKNNGWEIGFYVQKIWTPIKQEWLK